MDEKKIPSFERSFGRIAELPENERPYERTERYGAASLTDAELLAVIITSGTKNRTAVELARFVLALCKDGDLSDLRNVSREELQSIRGVGRVKSLQLAALCELSGRLEKRRLKRVNCGNVDELGECLAEDMSSYTQEVFRTLVLDKKLGLISSRDVFVGTVDAAFAHPRETFREAVRHLGSFVVLAHNHPSGDVLPGNDDFNTTRRMIAAGDILGIKVVDHIVVGNGKFYSMHSHGDIERLRQEAKGFNI